MVKVLLWLGLVGALLLTVVNRGHSHDHGRPELNDWFDRLRSSDGSLCCTHTEPVVIDNWETKDGQYRINFENQWIDVPDSAVIKTPNRAGKPMVWWGYPKTTMGPKVVRCFMPGTMT